MNRVILMHQVCLTGRGFTPQFILSWITMYIAHYLGCVVFLVCATTTSRLGFLVTSVTYYRDASGYAINITPKSVSPASSTNLCRLPYGLCLTSSSLA